MRIRDIIHPVTQSISVHNLKVSFPPDNELSIKLLTLCFMVFDGYLPKILQL
jgi:hypothetical protein